MPLAIPPGSSRTPGAPHDPLLAVEAQAVADAPDGRRGRAARGSGGEGDVDVGAVGRLPVPGVAGQLELAEQRRVDEPVAASRRPQRGRDRARAAAAEAGTAGRGSRLSRLSSLSGSKRESAASTASMCEWMPSAQRLELGLVVAAPTPAAPAPRRPSRGRPGRRGS